MATYYLDPNGDAKADWTEVPPGPSWSTVDDGVRDPTVPDLDDYTFTTTSGNAVWNVPDPTIPDDERIFRVRTVLYAEASAGSSLVHWPLTTLAGQPNAAPSVQVPPGDPAAWSVGNWLEREFNTHEANQLQIWTLQETNDESATIYAAYLEIETYPKGGKRQLARPGVRFR